MSFKDFTSKVGFQIKKHTPEILTGTAIVTGIGAFVLALVKAEDVKQKIEEHKERMEELHKDIDEMGEELTPSDRRRLVAAEYGKTAVEVGKELALPLALEVTSVGCIVAKYVDDKKRFTAISTLLAASIAGNNEYRRRVAEKIGEKEEEELFLGTQEEEIEETYIDEKGKEKTRKIKEKTYNPIGPYCITWGIVYDKDGEPRATSRYYKSYETNELRYSFLEGVQRECNNLLIAKGYLTLAEVFDLLGYEDYLKSKETIDMAKEVGWIYNKNNQVGDPYVKIGIGKDNKNSFDFKDGKEDFIILQFNCLGSINAEIPKLFLDYVR